MNFQGDINNLTRGFFYPLDQKRVNEDVIDYDLLEDFICHVDETCGEGAILVFLPVCPLPEPLIGSSMHMFFCIKKSNFVY